jgi:cytochrome c biogenesis protein CcmG, thiol:disulfide interchange protein DsbE
MIFSSRTGKGISAFAKWTGFALCLALVLLTGASWGSKRPVVGRDAPEFTLAGLNHQDPVALSGLRGRVVFIDFWASWCIPCRQLMPRIAALKAAYPDLEIVAISVDANRDKALTFLRAVEPSLRAVHDADHKVADAYGVERMPSGFLIDKAGKLRFRHDGYSAESLEDMERQIRVLLEE